MNIIESGIKDTNIYLTLSNNWVTIRNKTKQKLDPKFLGPYKILYYGPFYTYKLTDAKNNILKILVNHNRLQQANVENELTVKQWTKGVGRQEKVQKEVQKEVIPDGG
ncbi:hypothetical protein BB561_003776 [Smittium simulii]|uniref:Uncharacterized protein n=1 Tax=Smittium simulii TaxID=133385 RepID=A0A2T9YJI7_9FUNG|nr:hypothetical protein BB561_003776 [Smittium simulii]